MFKKVLFILVVLFGVISISNAGDIWNDPTTSSSYYSNYVRQKYFDEPAQRDYEMQERAYDQYVDDFQSGKSWDQMLEHYSNNLHPYGGVK